MTRVLSKDSENISWVESKLYAVDSRVLAVTVVFGKDMYVSGVKAGLYICVGQT